MFVADLSIPSSLNFSAKPGDTVYVFTYTKDAEGVISMSWTNRLGQLVQTAHEVKAVGADMKNWEWAMKRYEYDRRGLLSRTVTPLDVKNNNFDFAIVSYYDGSGREIQRVSPDVGSQYFYYGIAGNMRASISSEQLSRQVFTYKKYDEQGRLVSIGESALPISQYNDDFIRKAALNDSDLPGTKVEYSGRGYDKLSKCLDAIGESTVSSFMNGKNLENTRGRTACAWTRNPKVVGAVTSGEAVVADFFSYDSVGRVKVSYRFTGVEKDANRKLISKHAEYDDLGVLKNVSIQDAQGNELSRRVFKYDAKGRIASVEDASGNELVAYVYDDFGRQSEVVVGGAFRMEYDRHLHGQLTKITATKANSTDVLYEQKLSYEDATGIAIPRFDGRISQINSSVQAQGSTVSNNYAYIYDMMGNMTRKLAAGALGRENAGGGREWYVKDYQGSLVMTIVNDAVGNVIAYEPYGSQKLLQANGDMPSEQYTGKEYVGRLGLYYFGARFFDPFFGMWMSPDPAGQFANPYTYGGDPMNYVDPNGEVVHIIVGAVVGAVAEAAGAGLGGAVGGAVGSAGQYAINYAQQKVSGLDPKWDSSEFWTGVGIGAGLGALTAGLQYGLVDRYALEVDRTVAKWGNRLDMLDRAAKAVGSSGNYDVAMGGWFANTQSGTTDYNPVTDGTTFGQSNYDPTRNRVTLYKDDFMVKFGDKMKFDADRFLYAAKHETMHYELTEKAIAMSTTPDLERNLDEGAFMNKYGMPQETITKDISNYRYGRYWSPELKNTINNSLDEQWQYIRQKSLQKNTDQFRALLGYEVVNEY